MTSLELRGLWHRYPKAQSDTLRGVSVEVPDGQLVSVIGPSGSGKSTLLRIAAGLQPTSAGQVLVGGRDVTGLPTERRDLTVMFQSPLLFDHLDVAGNIGFAPRLAGAGRREARRCAQRYLELVHLAGFGRRDVGSLSGGQQQRVALARALAAQRGVLLLDEPFSSLDRELRTAMHDLLAELRAALEPTILLSTHDVDEAAMAETTVVLIEGTVHQHAAMSELYHRPASLAVARLLGGFTEIPGTVCDGVHRSAWGRVPVDGVSGGAGEEVRAVLVVRREVLTIDRAERSDDPHGSAETMARVVRRRPAGTRAVAELVTDDDTAVEVELSVGQDVPVGTRLRVTLPAGRGRHWALGLAEQPRILAQTPPTVESR